MEYMSFYYICSKNLRLISASGVTFLCAASFLFLSACSSSKPPTPAFVTLPHVALQNTLISPAYNPTLNVGERLAAGNLIKVECYDDEHLSGEFRLTSEGKILMPYQVETMAAGLSIEELKSSLQRNFKAYFKSPPMFAIQVIDKSVYVRASGLVNKPGAYLVTSSSSLDEVIGLAGGLEKNQTGNSVATYATIEINATKASVKLSEYFAGNKSLVTGWVGGEQVFFQSADSHGNTAELFNTKYVQVMGQVRTPGEYLFSDNANLFAYLVKAGGPTDRANTSKMLLVRLQGEQVQAYPVSLEQISEAPQMQGGDILFVQADNPSDLQKDASTFGSFANVMSALATTVLVGVGL